MKNKVTSIIILAGGKGTRMNSNIPKVLMKLNGKPMINYLLESVRKSSNLKPIIVTSESNNDLIRKATLEFEPELVIQDKQLGTGYAVKSVIDKINNLQKCVLVLYADHPLISSETIKKMIDTHKSENYIFTMLVASVPYYKDNYNNFYNDGRIIRNDKGEIVKIVEPNEAIDHEMEIKEINPAIFCIDTEWLSSNIHKIKLNKEKNEYYLTKLVEIAQNQSVTINSVNANIEECWGANTPEQFENIKQILTNK